MDIQDAVFVYQMKDLKELRWHGRTHSHRESEYEIHYFLGGSGEFINGNTSYSIHPGYLFISSPDVVHTIKAQAEDPLTYYAILISFEKESRAIMEMLSNQEKNNPYSIGTNYRFFFEEIKEKGLSNSLSKRKSASHQLCSLCYLLDEGALDISKDSESRHLEKALRIMQKNVMGNLTLGDLAYELNLTESYFIRLFSRRMGQTPMKYYMKLKIEAASALLTCTELSVKEIAAKLRFSSEFHFSKQFKQKIGIAPTYYRQNYTQNIGIPSEIGE